MKNTKIFIIEDDRLTALDLRNTLRRIGYSVSDPAASGAEAVAKVKEIKPDLIITDISLEGDLDGIDTVHVIQKDLDVPVIYFTAYSSPEMFKRALETNPYGYLVKPVSMDDLYTTIETALKRSDLERKLRISEIRFRLAFENAMDAMIWADAETGTLIDCNRSAEWLFEMRRDEMVGLHFTALHPADDEKSIRLVFEEKARGSMEPVEVRIVTKTGVIKIITINTSVTRMEKRIVVQGIFRDITQQKEAEAALQLNQTRLQALISLGQKSALLPEREIIDLGLEEAVRLTRSRIGYLHFISPDGNMVQYYAWSREAIKTCTAAAGTHYPLDKAGLWADCARTGKPVIHNDFAAGKHDLPPGHTPVIRHMSVPVMEQERATMIIGVGNKEADYDESDVNMLELIAEDIWKIIERKRADDALRESEERYRALFEESPEPIVIFDIDGFVLNVNPAFQTHTGYSRDETRGLNLTELPILDAKTIPDYLAIYREIMKTHQLHRMELPINHRNGTKMFVEIFISPLMKHERIAGFQIIARDISARKKLEENLQESKEMLELRVRERTKKLVHEIDERAKTEIRLREGEEVARALINSPSEPVILVSADGTILDANAEYEKRLHRPKGDILGKSMFAFIDDVSAARYREKMDAVFGSGKAVRFEHQLGGGWYDTIIYPVPDHRGTVTKLAVFAHDITETRRLQKDIMAISELERQRIGQELHDGLGQKLTGIAFLAEALKGSMKEKGYPEVEDIEEISSNIAESIDHARKISSGLWTTRLESYDAEGALRELADDTETLFGITCRLDNRLREPVINSSVVINLYFICRESINNAIKHGRAGRIDIILSDDPESISLEIRDNGKGAPESFRKKTGIGLRIMQYRAGIIGGTCSFESSPEGFIVRTAIRKEFIETYL